MRTEPGLVPEMLVFAKVVELRSFAAAARQLELTTSAVSRSVGRLEAHWGVQLLHRTTRSLSLTELGPRSMPPAASWPTPPATSTPLPATTAAYRAARCG